MEFSKEKLAKMHVLALRDFSNVSDREKDSRDRAIYDIRFTNVVGAQSDESFDTREDVYKGEINRVAGLVDQVTGGNRENRSNIKYLPTGESSDNDTAEIKSGIARHIENSSDANTIYDQGFDESVTGGFGGWRLITEFEDDGFDQVIKLKAINSAASSLFFHVDATDYAKRDASSGWLVTGIHPDSFKEKYPNATVADFPLEKYGQGTYKSWFTPEQTMLAEYWWKEPVEKTIVQLTDGRVVDEEEEKDVLDDLAKKGITIFKDAQGKEKRRTFKSHKVFMMEMNGAEFLTEPKEFPSKFIPLVPEYGRVTHVENETHVRGLIRFAIDPQLNYNYETNNQIQIGAEVMDDPLWITAKQAAGYEDELQSYKVERPWAMIFNPDPDMPGIPQRGGAPAVQQMAMNRIKQSEMDIYATTNMYPPSLGLNVGLESGVALRHQDEKGDRGSYVFVDNHMKSIKYTGEIIEDMIGRVYDTDRVVPILNLDGTTESKRINEIKSVTGEAVIDGQTGETVIVNDIRQHFGTVVDVSKAYTTQQQETLDKLIQLIGADDTFRAISTDLVAKSSGVIGADELYKRARKLMIKQGTAEPSDEEIKDFGLDQEQKPDPQTQAMTDNIDMDTAKKRSDIEVNDLKVDQIITTNIKSATDAYEKLIAAFEKQVALGIPLTNEDLQAKRDALAMIEIAQGSVRPN